MRTLALAKVEYNRALRGVDKRQIEKTATQVLMRFLEWVNR